LEGDGIKELVLIHDVDKHPVTDEVIHVDFLAVKADEKVEAEVPVVLVGESPVEKNNLGRIELVKDTILVEAYPQDLPHEIKVDVSAIKTPTDVIHVSDLPVPENVVIKENPEETIVTVVEFESEAEESSEETAETNEEASS
jgi:large subunit ribosomal protein L25